MTTASTVRRVRRRLRPLRPDPRRWYGVADPRSWAVLATHLRAADHPRHDLRRAAALVRQVRRSGNFLVTLPRSGSNWLLLQLAVASDLSRGGDGEYRYRSGATPAGAGKWEPGCAVGWDAPPHLLALQLRSRPDDEILPGAFLTSHHPADRPVLDPTRLPSVILLRDPVAQLDSVFRMVGEWAVLNRPGRFDDLVGATVDFFNLWGSRVVALGAEHHPVLRYEDLSSDPASALTFLSGRFGLGLTPDAVDRAVAMTSRDELLARQPSEDWRVSRTEDAAELPDELWERALSRLDAELEHRFGYDLERAPRG